MDRPNKQSSSTFAVDLFGPIDSSSKSSNSSNDFFGSIFGPQTSMVPGKDPSPQVKGNLNAMKKDINPSYENGRSVEPCYYNSSIYYGGQEIYSPQNCKKHGANADQSESNSTCASRGNWWQGSLYY